jgi:adenylate cyclase
VPGLVCFEGRAYPALVVAALAAATGHTPQWLAGVAPNGEGLIRVGDFSLPSNARGELRVSYAVPRGGFMAVSAADVIAGRIPEGVLKGTWVLVGSTAFGAGDAVVTPQGRAVGGVEVHAQLLGAALDHRMPRDPGSAGWLIAGACVLTLLFSLAALVPTRPGPALSLSGVALLNLGWIFGAHAYLLLKQHMMVHWSTPALFGILCAALLLVEELLRIRFEKERLYKNLSSYLPEAAARRLALLEPAAVVQAERREATVMVLDLRNFSAFCEGRSPEESAAVLHHFYITVENEVSARGGVVEHLVGDGIVAAWNASLPCEEHAARAFDAAAPIWRAVVSQLPTDATRMSPPLDLGIGIEAGQVLVGSFGAAQRRAHAVLGETVTVAVRLEALTGELAYPILLGPGIVSRLADAAPRISYPLKPLGNFLLAGLSSSRRVHALQIAFDRKALHTAYRIDQDRALAS